MPTASLCINVTYYEVEMCFSVTGMIFFFFFGVLYYESRISLFGDGDLQKRGLGV